jgi:hypothetical protein
MSLCNVNIGTGAVYHYSVDITLRGLLPLKFVREYDSTHRLSSALGFGWRHNHDRELRLNRDSASYAGPDRVILCLIQTFRLQLKATFVPGGNQERCW